jgi:NADH-quinone oxidoreductase subunit J
VDVVTIVFLVAAAMAVVFALVAVTHRSPAINVLSLIMMFFAMAGIFALLGMDFLAAVQVIVYSGAVLVLFLFVIMLLNLRQVETLGSGRPLQAVVGAIAALGLGGSVVWIASGLSPDLGTVMAGAEAGTAVPIGRALVGSHLLPFEMITLLLVAAIVGAVYLAQREAR